jgi:hypothetical protein
MTPAAVSLALRLQSVTTDADARALLIVALNDGATADELRQALDEWRAMRAADVTTLQTGEVA